MTSLSTHISNCDDIGQCWIFAILWLPFWKGRPVEIFQFQESIRDIIIYPHMKWRWNRTMLNLCGIVVAILKMATGRNFSMSGINSGHHYLPTYQIWWYRTMLNFCDIVVAILKMATSRNCSMSGLNSGHHYLPTYQIVMISDNVEFLRYCGGHFKNGDQKKLFNVGTQFLTSLSTHISNCDDIGQCWIFAILWWPFRK